MPTFSPSGELGGNCQRRLAASGVANLFPAAPDDAVLIESVNEKYGSNIVLDDFRRSYIWVLNVTMNQYMFSDPATKNAADLAAAAGYGRCGGAED